MSLRIGQNILSQVAQRHLSDATDSVSRISERLSSGQRINRAADDAAGLAVASSLRVDARVFAQGIRNINDGISVLSIADGAISELSKVITRQAELSAQAANGTFSTTQRLSLQQEADALTREFNRIVASTTFNGRSLFDTTSGSLRLQLGYGESGSLDVSYLSAFTRRVGDGTFSASTTLHNEIARTVFTVDVDGDGDLDILNSNDNGTGNISLALNNGDGTFAAAQSIGMGNGVIRMTVGDLNGDGIEDIVAVGSNISYRLGNGDGSFSDMVSASRPGGYTTLNSVRIADLDGDGRGEIVAVGTVGSGNPSHANIYSVGTGTLTLSRQLQYHPGSFTSDSVELGDLNGDGIVDVAVQAQDGRTRVFFGNGDGSFGSQVTLGFTSDKSSIALGDLDRDGDLDIVVSGSTGLSFWLNNGNGTFSSSGLTHSTTSTYMPDILKLVDINGDGNLDAVYGEITDGTTTGSYLNISYGNGDGTFTSITSYLLRSANTIRGFTFGDLDGDGIEELVVGANGTAMTIFEPNLTESTQTKFLNLLDIESARESLDFARSSIERLAQARGKIGSNQARLNVALNNLSVQRENYIASESRITDADVAFESAQLVLKSINQKAAAAVLAQANQQPQLALRLLKGGG